MKAGDFIREFGKHEARTFCKDGLGFGDVYCKNKDKYISVECDIDELRKLNNNLEILYSTIETNYRIRCDLLKIETIIDLGKNELLNHWDDDLYECTLEGYPSVVSKNEFSQVISYIESNY